MSLEPGYKRHNPKGTKGIILAGGVGTRLYPLTSLYSKQLVAVYDKPMVYYPLSILILAGIREILIISDEKTLPSYKKLFGDGSQYGLDIEYALQDKPRGIAEAMIIGEGFSGEKDTVLILGDNIFYGTLSFLRNAVAENKGATVFGYYVNDPKSYGVVEFDKEGKAISLEEKPSKPKSNYAIPGLYVYDNTAAERAKNLKPSPRGELEITDLNKAYMSEGKLRVEMMNRGIAWLDSGTPDSLLDSSNFIASVEKRQGLKIGCIEEVALRMGMIDKEGFNRLIQNLPNCYYREYLERISQDF
ncbi:MAG: glucose-1-phosphate thymidylyltransferase RfbA [Candidatus Kapaibacteriales bacterium]